MNILLLSGSFHSNSVSLSLLNYIGACLLEHELETPMLNKLPFFSEDIVGEHQPDQVTVFLHQVINTDAIICCSPEYNHSIPAVLKNAIDWASRPAFNSPLKDKPVTFITQANSPVGGARAQAHMKLIFDATLSRLHNSHEMLIADINNKVNAQQQLTDEETKNRLKRHVDDFLQFI